MSDGVSIHATNTIRDGDAVPIPARYWWLKRIGAATGVLLVLLGAMRWYWGWEADRRLQAEIEQPLYAQVWGMAKFMDKIIAKGELKAGTYDVIGLDGILTMEAWGPNLALPGAAITPKNVDESRFWGNLKPPTAPVDPVM